ncbi:GNAT family N-acetyltransferase [Simiduia curdlanivorans]|uniref:GNAT family N-acetyltransferase n=1 Tax=Simiduia curdlanivorans TaxID=1492769 RepID=A0ABV8V792_9GAMM|nr:GNAT family N-acetyltransferase [Simiduia curdlanivorans]MDN3640551.1 GNAT family N-acetyltransferase [Simiduia curdlanivorans]
MIKLAVTDAEILSCFPVLVQLRPKLVRGRFLKQVRQMQTEGFQMAFLQDEGRVVAVAGFRVSSNLFMGKNLYVDDLITDAEHRSKGYGEEMIAWLEAFARVQGCLVLHLDSGTQRQQAHKFYFAQGFPITSFHFSKPLVD